MYLLLQLVTFLPYLVTVLIMHLVVARIQPRQAVWAPKASRMPRVRKSIRHGLSLLSDAMSDRLDFHGLAFVALGRWQRLCRAALRRRLCRGSHRRVASLGLCRARLRRGLQLTWRTA